MNTKKSSRKNSLLSALVLLTLLTSCLDKDKSVKSSSNDNNSDNTTKVSQSKTKKTADEAIAATNEIVEQNIDHQVFAQEEIQKALQLKIEELQVDYVELIEQTQRDRDTTEIIGKHSTHVKAELKDMLGQKIEEFGTQFIERDPKDIQSTLKAEELIGKLHLNVTAQLNQNVDALADKLTRDAIEGKTETSEDVSKAVSDISKVAASGIIDQENLKRVQGLEEINAQNLINVNTTLQEKLEQKLKEGLK